VEEPDAADVWSRRAREWAQGFSWDTTTARLLDVVTQEERRLRRGTGLQEPEQRRANDIACHVSLPADAPAASALASSGRGTDVWVRSGDRIEALMPGTDETGVRRALQRLDLADCAQIRVARPADWLLVGTPLS
jgi:hypothetical protein